MTSSNWTLELPKEYWMSSKILYQANPIVERPSRDSSRDYSNCEWVIIE